MTNEPSPHVQKIVAHLLVVPDALVPLVAVMFDHMGGDEDVFEVMEAICVAALGPRVECTVCDSGTENFPGVPCWECDAVDGVRP